MFANRLEDDGTDYSNDRYLSYIVRLGLRMKFQTKYLTKYSIARAKMYVPHWYKFKDSFLTLNIKFMYRGIVCKKPSRKRYGK